MVKTEKLSRELQTFPGKLGGKKPTDGLAKPRQQDSKWVGDLESAQRDNRVGESCAAVSPRQLRIRDNTRPGAVFLRRQGAAWG